MSNDDREARDRSFVLRTIIVVLAISALSVVFALLAGLRNPAIDNDRIFTILTPLSQQISGALISIVSGMLVYKATKKDDK